MAEKDQTPQTRASRIRERLDWFVGTLKTRQGRRPACSWLGVNTARVLQQVFRPARFNHSTMTLNAAKSQQGNWWRCLNLHKRCVLWYSIRQLLPALLTSTSSRWARVATASSTLNPMHFLAPCSASLAGWASRIHDWFQKRENIALKPAPPRFSYFQSNAELQS